MMTNVNSASDSINARPRIRKTKIPGRAPGLRARASVAEAVALPWPRPQRPAASAMPRPAAIGTHWLAGLYAVACPKAGVASSIADSVMKKYCNLRIVLLRSPKVRRQWVVDAHRAGTLTLNGVGAHREEGENLRREIKVVTPGFSPE